jgi:hypothetical protein
VRSPFQSYLKTSLSLPFSYLAIPFVWSALPSAFFSSSPVTKPTSFLYTALGLIRLPSALVLTATLSSRVRALSPFFSSYVRFIYLDSGGGGIVTFARHF